MAYNLTNMTDAVGMGRLFLVANDYAGGLLGGLFVIALFIILMMTTTARYGFMNALLFASFACFLISSVMWFIPAVPMVLPLLFLALLAFAFLFSVSTRT